MDRQFQKRKFTELRLEYYAAGRMLWFNDTMSIAAMLLGYAVELSLKQALVVAGASDKDKILYSHVIPDLFAECSARGCVSRMEVSSDLLVYVSDMLNQRYPSQVTQAVLAAEQRGHAIGQSLDLIVAYDDFIIQLDDSLRTQCSDDSVSVGVLAAHFVNRVQGRAFFHCNVAALRNTDLYREILTGEYQGAEQQMRAQGLTEDTIFYNLTNQNARLKVWAGAPQSIWEYEKLSTRVGPDFDTLKSAKYSRDFVYPGRAVKHQV